MAAKRPANTRTALPQRPDELQRTLAELREANERLIVAGVRMQELAEEAQRARADAESANKAKDEFLAALSHELRTPLSAILGWIQVLRRMPGTSPAADHAFEVIERNARQQAQLITDVLRVAEIISGKLRLEPVLIELGPIVQGSIEALRLAAAAKSIDVAVDIEAGASPVLADPARVDQVVANVLSNAIKFTPRDGRISIKLSQSAASVVLSIKDSGIGIEPSIAARIFDRFFQADSSATRTFGGLGLGLAIAKRLMELHRGSIAAESSGTGCGTTFTMTFPLAASSLSQDKPPEIMAAGSLRGVRILVVEDRVDARELMTALLQPRGASVTAVSTVPEALTQWRQSQWDMVIADIGLPGQNGYELIRQIRSLEARSSAHVAAVALTAYAQPKDRDKALSAGFDLHLTKPFEADAFLRQIGQLAHRH